ncbi:DUF2169 family type VI secretion system accessory protein [Roseateles chitosanitabidus]|uniref:DUF2169 family type VI secretion system accessory protein n=1 Tax=Roseateles chitosanitabidus TaxID=65048 RepID=UPI00083620D7|nr:DUF2169 domain-containing protein [Roseateles chitosanitabidus]MBO9688280.1 DUF2169 domain-containing protein [Roseateles chitosanitabidus]
MQLHVGSRHLAADAAVALDATGREHLVIAVKATWQIPDPGQRPRPLPPQAIVLADDYLGAPGESPMRYGADMARFKARCDVILDAQAHAPDGLAVRELVAGVEVGEFNKRVRVIGERRWRATGSRREDFTLTEPEPFISLPLHHAFAFGGTRSLPEGEGHAEVHEFNPIGLGFAGEGTWRAMDGLPAPRLEDPSRPLRHPGDEALPWALGAIGRHWLPRRAHAGTYDERWRRDVFPLPPEDFDERFHQVAPPDQQMPYPRGGERVRLTHLMRELPQLSFALPRLDMQVRVLRANYQQEAPTAVVDTLFFEPEERRFSVVWRASVRQYRSIQEFSEVAIGPVDPVWWRQRISGGCAGCGGVPGAAEDTSPDEVTA